MNKINVREMDRAHHIHPFNDMKLMKARDALVIDRAEGIYVYDDEGKRYLDGMAGLWCVNLGYGRSELAAVAQQQMNTLPYYNTFFQSTTAPAAKLAAKLTELAPGDIDHVFFANSGSEANDTIVRLARTYWESVGQPAKKGIISRRESYHGSTMVGASLCGLPYMHPTTDLPLPHFYHINSPYHYRDSQGEEFNAFGERLAKDLEKKILELGPNNVAAFHADTIASGGGVIVPPDSYWPEIVRICKQYDVLLSIDEVITGFGRVGAWFSASLYGLEPDFISIAKGLSSGYIPISAALVSRRVADVLTESNKPFNHGFTYSGHPVSAAVALENIRILEDEAIIQNVHDESGPYLQRKVRALSEHPLVGDVRGRGFIVGVELIAEEGDEPSKGTRGKRCFDLCLQHGLITRPLGNTMAFSPPLIMNKNEIDEMIEIFNHCLDLL